jgi:hypothetical protein
MPDDPSSSSAGPTAWPPWRRFFFRFAFIYFIFYTLPAIWRFSLIGAIPCTEPFAQIWSDATRKFMAWVAAQYFGIYYMTDVMPLIKVEIPVLLFVSLVGALIWTLLDRKRTNYVALHAGFRVWLRYTLAFTLFIYGFAKVFPVQMIFSRLSLTQRWGDFSLFDALWAFMAASKPYQIFSGVMEVLPGILLLFRRTTPLGAAIALAVMTNVTALDYFYDIPPKIYAAHLALISIFLLLPDASRLANVFVFNRPAPPADLSRPLLPQAWMRVTARLLWVVVVAGVINKDVRQGLRRYKRAYDEPLTPVHGLYSVEAFRRNGQAVPPLITDDSRWHWVDFFEKSAMEASMTGDWHGYDLRFDTNKSSSLTLATGTNVWTFKYAWAGTNADTNYLDLHGTNGTNVLEVRLHKADLSKFALMESPFR